MTILNIKRGGSALGCCALWKINMARLC